MKHMYTSLSRNLLRILCCTVLLLTSAKSAKACHGVALLNLTATPVATGIKIDANSDPATCGCGPYWMQIEVTCNPAGFTGNPPVSSSPLWGTAPWYHSLLNVPNYNAASGWPDNCALEPYLSDTIPYSQLCTGTTYYWRAREYVEGDNSMGPWSASASFVTPGLPPAAVLVATSNQYDVCPGTTVQLNANVTGGCPGALATYSWSPVTGLSNPNIANPTALINSAITYTVTATGGCFTITSSDDTVQISMAPNVTAGTATGSPLSVCSGGSSQIILTGMGSNNIQWQISPNGTSWFNISGATDDTLNTGPISSSLYYQAVVTGSGWPGNGCGTATSNVVQVTVSPAPTANAGANQTICTGGCANLSGSGGVSYDWQPGNLSGANISVCPVSSTTYTLTVTDAGGCTGTANVTVNISTPSVTASPDVSICSGNSTILLASGPNGNTYSWAPAGTLTGANTANPSATPAATTTYTVTSTNAFGCTAMDSVMVTVTPPQALSVSNDTSLCSGGSATLNVSGASSYSWQPGNMSGSSATVSPSTTTTYTITGTTNNCTSVDSITVTIAPPLNVFAGPDFSICSGTQATLNVGATGTYNWQPSSSIVGSNTAQSIVIAPTGNTSYTITVTDANGCIATDVVNVGINPLPNVTAVANPSSLCPGGSTTINASGGNTYSWTPAIGLSSTTAASTNASPSNTTTYQVVGTNANGCTDTASITINVFPQPGVYLIPTPTECGDTTGAMTDGGVVSGTPPFTYTVNSQTYTSLPITGFSAGSYFVNVTDANGCTNTENVDIGSVLTATVSATADTYFGVYPLTVNFTGIGSPGVNNYSWSFGANTQNASYTYTTPGIYSVILTAYNDITGCSVYAYITIEVVDQAMVQLPNVFTPNSDGINDDFAAIISGVKDMKVELFNRWGNSIYSTEINDIPSSPQTLPLWNGKSMPDGTYYYVINATGYDTKPYLYKGFVQLLTK